ncbi:SPFH domain-containing protein [Clostridium sp. WILCCON 0269]|uniref:SPFH domain-containing protein n=1 Tax=Candidatus Clostridium eludens TaxID=3381663 RepID=A0ABW8SIU2_9CLOT
MSSNLLIHFAFIGGIIVGILVLIVIIVKVVGIIIIHSDEVGIEEKWWSLKGTLDKQIIALNGESGFQPDLLRAGIYLRSPIMYHIHRAPLITIPQGKIAYVFARDGKSLDTTQTLGKVIKESDNFQDVRAFLANGGQKGPQRAILREGTYAINLAQFIVITEEQVYSLVADTEYEQMKIKIQALNGFTPVIINGKSDLIGIVTVNEGPSLPNGEIIAPVVAQNTSDENYHNNFQDIEKFLAAGGLKGRQYQTLSDGTYFINRLFATVELLPKTVIDVTEVGVVTSYYGSKGEDVTGSKYTHGELVSQGSKGIWEVALQPGKYAFNTYAGRIIKVPTINIILKWMQNQSGNHKLDENLKEISLITKDAFEPVLPLTVVMHIDYKNASRVIQRFGDIKILIEQSLDPMIAGYFKNIGQQMTLIELIQNRNEIQSRASEEMKERFSRYDLELEEVLIGTPAASPNDSRINTILQQLRDRQVAKEQIATYDAQQKSADKMKELEEAKAKANAQAALTQSDIDITIADNKGKAALKSAEQEAAKIKALSEADKYKSNQKAEADRYAREQDAEATAKTVELTAKANAEKVKVTADADSYELETIGNAKALNIKAVASAEADKETKVGTAKGIAAKALVDAYGGPELQVVQSVLTQFAEALKVSKSPLVPNTIITAAGDGKTPNAMEGILSLVLANIANGKGLLVPKDIESSKITEKQDEADKTDNQ